MPILDVRHLSKHFTRADGLVAGGHAVTAVDDVSFAVEEGETFGIVGESGSGKTTLARCVLRLVEPASGQVFFRGEDLLLLPRARMREMRRHLQLVFQDPFGSLNPRMRVGQIVAEPLDIHRVGTAAERRARVAELLRLVGLDPDLRERYPHEFSGGQRQRIGLARALALSPALVIADEPVSALDVSVQAQIINLLVDLQRRLSLTYVLIAHDLRLVRHVCGRVAVMYRGRIVEMGQTAAIFERARHPYTQALLAAVPSLEPGAQRRRVSLDPASFVEGVPLKAVGDDHWAAV